MKDELKIPKAYLYTVDGVLNEEGELRKFSTPSLSRDINDDFELDSVANSAALFFFLDNEDYQAEDKWPLVFRFTSHTKEAKEVTMTLSFAPSFSSSIKPKEPEVVKKTRTRRKAPVKKEETNSD